MLTNNKLYTLLLALPMVCGFLPLSLLPHRTRTQHRMFTGIVEEMGSVVSLEERDDMTLWDGTMGKGTELTVKADIALQGAYLGCSICVSGVCLTATALADDTFKVGLAPETLSKTYFSSLKPGDPVNLERASVIGGRNSGHFVQGHVDGTGKIIEKRTEKDSLWIKVETSPEIIRYIVPKGFIAIDGTSLTVVDVNREENWFTFMLIEYTQKKIVVPGKPVGSLINIEVDVLGKYAGSSDVDLIPRVEALEAKVASLEERLAPLLELEALQAKARVTLKALGTKVAALQEKLDSLLELEALQAKVASPEERLESILESTKAN